MLPGDAQYTPLSIVARIAIALDQLRIYRAEGDASREFAWSNALDRLLDMHTKLLQASGRFRPLEELDPELSERLAVPAPDIRYVVPESRVRPHP